MLLLTQCLNRSSYLDSFDVFGNYAHRKERMNRGKESGIASRQQCFRTFWLVAGSHLSCIPQCEMTVFEQRRLMYRQYRGELKDPPLNPLNLLFERALAMAQLRSTSHRRIHYHSVSRSISRPHSSQNSNFTCYSLRLLLYILLAGLI